MICLFPLQDPTPIDLIVQFIYNGMKRNENSAAANESELLDSTTQRITDKMKHVLTVLPLQVAAHLYWDLNLFQQRLPLHIQDSLVVALLHETMEEYSNPASHATLDTGPLLPYQLFSISLYHRYALSTLVKAKLPSKPIRISNVTIPGQQDPMQESREVYDGIISVLERGSEVSVRILEQLLTSGEVRAPVLQSFSPIKNDPKECPHYWNRCTLVPDEQFKYQVIITKIHFDLGNFHFLQERFSEALHHFTEAQQLIPELGSSPEFCHLEEEKLRGFYRSCSTICGRATPVAKRSLYDRFIHCLSNNFEGLIEILTEDNLNTQIPFYLRQSLQLDLMTKHEKLSEGFLFHVQTLNTIGDVLEGRCWDNNYPIYLLQAGKEGTQYLVQLLGSKATQYSAVQRQRVRTFVETLALCEGQREPLVSQVMTCAPLASIFTHEEIVALWPGAENKSAKEIKKAFDVSLGGDLNNINDLIWDLNHSYDPVLLEKTFKLYLTAKPLRATQTKFDTMDLNCKWREDNIIPIPVRNTVMKLVPDPHKSLVLIYIAKSHELTLVKSFSGALDLLNEAMNLATRLVSKENQRICKMFKWMILTTKIQQQINKLPCVEENEIRNLTIESKQCLAALAGGGGGNRELIVPWNNITYWCVMLLLNAQDWAFILGNLGPITSHYNFIFFLKPLAATAQALQTKLPHKQSWHELFEIVADIVVGRSLRRDQSLLTRSQFLDIIEGIKEPLCLSTNISLCSSWFLTKADLAFNQKLFRKAIQNYLTAIFVATNYLRNDTNNPEQNAMDNVVLRRMISCCMALDSYTQAAVLCQFLEPIDYNTGIRCIQERNAIDGMDAYYNCLFDVTLMEFIINMHQKKGEVQRKDKVMKIIGLLEINSNNNEEIQREAAKVRKHRFLRAMGKLYL
ncbi:Integrator complex subunit 8 [Armadillidium nasatum]|uniref:Integrator complex subunit 8 n=1 Tax=Armadillidium nasatum TaxID=96803 RepID=A0A5N5TJB4_9CRUS|nr:Integrator complex subunit 8 [Armadillidium nasatum]